MKKKILITVVLLSVFVFLFYTGKVNAAENSDYENGDIKCPSPISNKNITCTQEPATGKANTVKITTTADNLTITKVVEKTDTPGKVDVHFEVSGSSATTTKKKAYIVFVFDTSGSLEKEYDKAKEAIEAFSKKLTGQYVALVQFASSYKKTSFKKISDKNNITAIYDDYATASKNLGEDSEVGGALSKTYELLKGKSKDAYKFVVLFGDGEYYNGVYTTWDTVTTAKKNLNKLHNLFTYGVRYKSSYEDSYWINTDTVNAGYKPLGCDAKKRADCNQKMMKYLMGEGESREGDWKQILEKIADEINEKIPDITYTGEVTDTIGDYFVLDGSDSRTHTDDIGEIKNNVITTTKFSITLNESQIESNSEDNWYPTNNQFVFDYEVSDTDKSSTVGVNPEMFWKIENPTPDKTHFDSCHDGLEYNDEAEEITVIDFDFASKMNSINDDSLRELNSGNSNYKLVCKEKVMVDEIIHEEEFGSQQFNIKDALGFTVGSSYDTNMECEYVFDMDAYNENLFFANYEIKAYYDWSLIDYNAYKAEMDKITATDKNVISYHNKTLSEYNWNPGWSDDELNQLASDRNNYEKWIKGRNEENDVLTNSLKYLDKYIYDIKQVNEWINDKNKLISFKDTYQNDVLKNFPERQIGSYLDSIKENMPTLTVTYDKSQFSQVITNQYFQNSDVSPLNYSCPDYTEGDLSKKCSIQFKRTVNLKPVCVSIKDGSIADCTEGSNTQLVGGNRYYLERGADGAHIGVTYTGLGFDRQLNITMDSTETSGVCYADVYKSSLLYRQVDASDPFITGEQYRDVNTRQVGINYYNGNYDFRGIISSTVWNNNPDYSYKLSKENIVNIKRDTDSRTVNSYLGSDCYVKSDTNQIVCPFARQIDPYGNGVYFSN